MVQPHTIDDGPTRAFRAGRRVAQSPIVRGFLSGSQRRRAAFRDDGGTPSYRSARAAARWAPFWLLVRFVWLFPLVAIGAAVFFVAAWVLCSAFVGEAFARSNWAFIVAFALVSGWQSLLGKKGSLGAGQLDFGRMAASPSQGIWGAIATLFRSFFVWLYAGYALLFWTAALGVLWAERAPLWHFALWG